MERKKRVDMHINIATALSDCIRSRNLDKFFEVEEKIMTKTTLEESVLDVSPSYLCASKYLVKAKIVSPSCPKFSWSGK